MYMCVFYQVIDDDGVYVRASLRSPVDGNVFEDCELQDLPMDEQGLYDLPPVEEGISQWDEGEVN